MGFEMFTFRPDTKVLPLSGGAGSSRTVHNAPVCTPIPEHSTVFVMVFCLEVTEQRAAAGHLVSDVLAPER